MKKKIKRIEIVGSNVMEIQRALTNLVGAARIASGGQNWGGSSTVGVEEAKHGEELASVDLIEETLSDGSKVYDIQLRFSNVE